MLVRACKTQNFGDTLNGELVRLITKKEPQIVNNSFKNLNNETIYMVIGSVLGWADSNTIVWGSGFISDIKPTIPHPKKICAVRGVLTRDLLIQNGYECPEIYGDPALVMPTFFEPNVDKLYDLSIIPHHVDKVLIPQIQKEYPKAHIIDIQQPIYNFITEVVQSKHVMSSALHGLIIADAYKVSNEHVKFSNNVLGNDFKFRDYQETKKYINLFSLAKACPFIK